MQEFFLPHGATKIELDIDHANGQVLSGDRGLDFRDLLLLSNYREEHPRRQLSMPAYFMCYVTAFSPQSAYKGFPNYTLFLAHFVQACLDTPTSYK